MGYILEPSMVSSCEQGIQKTRKPGSTGGGRAWSDDEEQYLLQTRTQKMPYKHIAAHLNKTELACRLHYHQLSHGSTRRKRASSSVSSSERSRSPSMSLEPGLTRFASPTRELSSSPPQCTYPAIQQQYQLPVILPRCESTSPPRSITPALPRMLSRPGMPARSHTSPYMGTEYRVQHNNRHSQSIDDIRLSHIYQRHNANLWASIALEYGSSVSAETLEQRFRSASGQILCEPTPSPSPPRSFSRSNSDQKISISDLLGVDASPQSPRDWEIVRQREARAREC